MTHRRVAITAVCALLLIAMWLLLQPFYGRQTAQSPTPTPVPTQYPSEPDPIFTSTDAISRSLELFPINHNANGATASLVASGVMHAWVSYGAFANFVPPAEEWTSYNNTQGPLWIVAILGDDLTPIIVMHPPPGVEITDDREADGAFYAWDANSGRLMQEGAFIHGAPHSYASLVALPTSNASIASATPWPTEPPITPLPSPTMSQSRLATLVPALTAQAIRYLTATPTP